MLRRLFFLALVAGAAAVLSSCHSNGLTFSVDTHADSVDTSPGDGVCADASGNCSLRAAVMEANALAGIDRIELAGGTYTLTIPGAAEDGSATGDLDFTEAVDLIGPGRIEGGGTDRVLDLRQTFGLVEIEGVEIAAGSSVSGAAIRARSGSGIVLDSVISGNTSPTGGPIEVKSGDFHLLNTTVSGNTGSAAGALYVVGGTFSATDATLSGNTGTGSAPGAIRVWGGTVDLDYVTITDNTGGATVGGIEVLGGSADVRASIVAAQASGDDCGGTLTSGGYNIESGSSCGFGATGDQSNTDPKLGALAANGGPVETHLPQVGSPAVEQIPAASCDDGADARGVARPQAGDCDAGAVEVAGMLVDSSGDDHDDNLGDGECHDNTSPSTCSLRAAIEELNATGGPMVIALGPGANPTLTIAGSGEDGSETGDLDIGDFVTIVGNGNTITQTTGDRVLDVHGPVDVSIDPITITGGSVTGDGGGIAIAAGATVVLDEAIVSYNSATGDAGGILNQGDLTVLDSVISENDAAWAGGIQNTGAGVLHMSSSIVSGNTAVDVGGIHHEGSGSTEVVDSSISFNTASDGNAGGGFSTGDLLVERSSFIGNEALGPTAGGFRGNGGAWVSGTGSDDVFRNVTFSGNSADRDGGAIWGIQGSDELVGVTVTDNSSGAGLGALEFWSPVSASVYGSIVADQASGLDCLSSSPASPFSSLGYNIESGTACAFTATGDQQSTSPLLGPLGNNGGPTFTHLPGALSTAIGAIPVGKAGLCDGTLPTDQRGVARPQGTNCDIGSVEQ